MDIAGLVKLSTIDFPGCLAAVLFTPGCNLDCFYCHNRELLDGHYERTLEKEAWSYLERRRNMLDGVVLSGGEPLMQVDLEDDLKRLRGLGFKSKLDTNGTWPERLGKLLDADLLDYVAVDVKAPWERYPQWTGAAPGDADRVAETLRLLSAGAIGWETRTTVIPQMSQEDLLAIAAILPPVVPWYLQTYRQPVRYRPEDRERVDALAWDRDALKKMATLLRPVHALCRVR